MRQRVSCQQSVSEGSPSRPHAACHLTMGRRKQGVPRKADGQDPTQAQLPAEENEGGHPVSKPVAPTTTVLSLPECQWKLAKVEDIVKSFAFESEMSGNIWSDCLRDRFDFQTSISAEQADTSLTDLLFPSRDFFVETQKTFCSNKGICPPGCHVNRERELYYLGTADDVKMLMSQYVEPKDT